jgi:hypothetical protein
LPDVATILNTVQHIPLAGMREYRSDNKRLRMTK